MSQPKHKFLEPGFVIGAVYRVLKVIGVGQAAVVYEVQHQETRLKFAGKVYMKHNCHGHPRPLPGSLSTEIKFLDILKGTAYLSRLHEKIETPECVMLLLQLHPNGSIL